MGAKSAYCGLYSRPDGTYLYLVPETEGGKILKFEDVDEYLSHMKINYDKVEVNSKITSLNERVDIKVSNDPLKFPEDEYMTVKLADNKLICSAKFYPPADGGNYMTDNDIVQRLQQYGVRFGYDMDEIKRHIAEKDYCIDLALAKAKLPREGKNAEITYYFNTDINQKPRTNEDGSVDFHNLDNINHIHRGDKLATLTPADPGDDGTDVCGGTLKPLKVIKKVLKYGNKIQANNDQTEIYSEVDGHVMLVDGRVFVSDNFEVATDVGPSTGDVDYQGSVTIKGNVVSGYTVKAHGDVIVEGVVEGANIIADGQIILKRGIQGANKGMLQAGSNIVAKFIENAEVRSGGYVQTEAIMHSKVFARTDINVGGKKGFITGGEVHSGTCISAKLAGNDMETRTLLEVGIDPNVMAEYRELEKNIPAWEEDFKKLTTILTVYAKKIKSGEKLDPKVILSVKQSMVQQEELKNKIEEGREKYMAMTEEMEGQTNGCIKISDTIFPGCRVIISNVSTYIKTPTQHGRLVRDGADIRVVAL